MQQSPETLHPFFLFVKHRKKDPSAFPKEIESSSSTLLMQTGPLFSKQSIAVFNLSLTQSYGQASFCSSNIPQRIQCDLNDLVPWDKGFPKTLQLMSFLPQRLTTNA